ncbi:MAG: DUF4282 domain-containing protein [Candidatus Woesearchaeota archaeon]
MTKNKKTNDFIGDFFFMDSLITPRIIKIINMAAIILLGLMSLGLFISGIVTTGFLGGLITFISAIIGSAISYIFIRIFLEISLILFRIEENTRKK